MTVASRCRFHYFTPLGIQFVPPGARFITAAAAGEAKGEGKTDDMENNNTAGKVITCKGKTHLLPVHGSMSRFRIGLSDRLGRFRRVSAILDTGVPYDLPNDMS